MDRFYEKTLNSEIVYEGKIFDIKHDEVELSNGAKSFRDIILHPGGVVIVAQKEEKILLVKQYRYAISEAIFELPAGKLEVGEDPFEAAKRIPPPDTSSERRRNQGFANTLSAIGNRLCQFKGRPNHQYQRRRVA